MKKIRIILILHICSFIAFTAQSQIVLDQIIAIVGDEMIKQSDIENQMIQMKQIGSKSNDLNACKLFEDILFQKLLIDQAKIDSIQVSDAEVDGEINRRIAMFVGEAGGLAKLESFYGKTELEIRTEWKPLIREQILAQRAQNAIIGNTEISPNEVRKFYTSMHPDSLPTIARQYEFAHIVIKPKFSAAEDAEIRKRLEEIRQRAVKGENFSKLAVLYSDDSESAKTGGSLGDYMSRGELVPEFAAAAFRLKEGEISRIVKTDFGYHIIQMVDIKGEKAKLKHILMRPKVTPQTLQKTLVKADSIHALISKDSIKFETAARQFSSDEKTKYNGGKYMNPYTGTSKFESEMIEPMVIVHLRKLQVGEISEPILSYDETGTQVYKILKLISITEEHKANITHDYQEIKDLALQKKNEKIIAAWIKQKQEKTYIYFPNTEFRACNFSHSGWIK